MCCTLDPGWCRWAHLQKESVLEWVHSQPSVSECNSYSLARTTAAVCHPMGPYRWWVTLQSCPNLGPLSPARDVSAGSWNHVKNGWWQHFDLCSPTGWLLRTNLSAQVNLLPRKISFSVASLSNCVLSPFKFLLPFLFFCCCCYFKMDFEMSLFPQGWQRWSKIRGYLKGFRVQHQ